MYTLYGIPNCNTVKEARDWLEQHQIAYQFHDFRKQGLTRELLEFFEAQVGWEILLNKQSASWRQLTAEQQAGICLETALEYMLATPTLIKRPVLDTGTKLIVGFKIEIYQNL